MRTARSSAPPAPGTAARTRSVSGPNAPATRTRAAGPATVRGAAKRGSRWRSSWPLQVTQHRIEQRGAQALTASAIPARARVRRVGVVLERHLERQRQTTECVTDVLGRELQD